MKGGGPFVVALYKGATIQGDFDTDQPTPGLPAVRQVKLEKSQEALARQINTGGGATSAAMSQFKTVNSLGETKLFMVMKLQAIKSVEKKSAWVIFRIAPELPLDLRAFPGIPIDWIVGQRIRANI